MKNQLIISPKGLIMTSLGWVGYLNSDTNCDKLIIRSSAIVIIMQVHSFCDSPSTTRAKCSLGENNLSILPPTALAFSSKPGTLMEVRIKFVQHILSVVTS